MVKNCWWWKNSSKHHCSSQHTPKQNQTKPNQTPSTWVSRHMETILRIEVKAMAELIVMIPYDWGMVRISESAIIFLIQLIISIHVHSSYRLWRKKCSKFGSTITWLLMFWNLGGLHISTTGVNNDVGTTSGTSNNSRIILIDLFGWKPLLIQKISSETNKYSTGAFKVQKGD